MPSTAALAGQRKRNSWIAVAVIGCAAVAAGMVVPQLLPTEPSLAQSSPAPQANKSASLAYTPPAWPEGPDPKSMITRLVLGTVIVLGLCVGTLAVSKRWLVGTPAKSPAAGPILLLDTVSLGNRCRVHLLGVGKQRILVGVDAAGLKSLVALAEPFDETLGEIQGGATAPLAT